MTKRDAGADVSENRSNLYVHKDRYPFVSVVIPVKPGLNPDAVDALEKIEYPADRIEIVIVYGKNPSAQRNAAVRIARADILYFLDNDSLPALKTLVLLVSHLGEDKVAVAGGPSVSPANLPLMPYIFSKTLESPLCTGSSSNRYRRTGEVRYTTEKEIILCNMVMRKKDFEAFGGLNERLYPNEENELMEKIRHAGMKLVYDPDAFVTRMPRRNLRAFIRQIFNYGRGRGEQTVFYPRSFSLLNFIPMVFVLYLLSAVFMPSWFLLPLVGYAALLAADALLKACREGDVRILLLPLTSIVLHVTYGIGTIYGLITAHRKKIAQGEIRIERLGMEKN